MAKPLDEPGYLSGGHAALAALYRDTWQPSWRPPPRLSVSEWAGRYRYLWGRKATKELRRFLMRYIEWFLVRVVKIKSLLGRRNEVPKEKISIFR